MWLRGDETAFRRSNYKVPRGDDIGTRIGTVWTITIQEISGVPCPNKPESRAKTAKPNGSVKNKRVAV